MNIWKRFAKDGCLTELTFDCLGLLGILIIWTTTYFFNEWSGLKFWLLLSMGTVVGYFGAYGGLAKKFGLNPFSSDPLGWRKAKESYETHEKKDV